MISTWKKIFAAFAVVILAGGSFVFVKPQPAHAIFGFDAMFCDDFEICPDPIFGPAEDASAVENGTTATSTTTNAAIDTAKFAADGTPWLTVVTDSVLTPTYCNTYADTNSFLDAADRLGKIVAGSDKSSITNTFFPSYQEDSYQSIMDDCWIPLEAAAQSAKGAANWQFQNIQQNRQVIAQGKKATQDLIDKYEKVQDDAFSNVYEGIVYNFTQSVAKEAAIKGVSTLSHELGNTNPDVLARALTNEVYGIQQINNTAGGSDETKLIAASLYKNQVLGDTTGLTTAQNLAAIEAKKYSVPAQTLNWSSPNYWNQVGNAANAQVFPEYHLMQGNATLSNVLTTSHELANTEIQTGAGYKNVRSCTDVTAQQTKINSDLATATKNLQSAQLALSEFNAFADEGGPDYQAAVQNVQTAQAAYDALKAKIGTGVVAPCQPNIQTLSQVASNASSQWLSTIFDQTKYNTANPTLAGTLAAKLGKTLGDELFNIPNGTTFGSILDTTGNNLLPVGINAGISELGGALSTPPPAIPNTHPTNNTSGSVKGAYTFEPRGPEVPYLPRGPEPGSN